MNLYDVEFLRARFAKLQKPYITSDDQARADRILQDLRNLLVNVPTEYARISFGVVTQDEDDSEPGYVLVCPHCGEALGSYFEDISSRRQLRVLTKDKDGRLVLSIDGYYETDGCDENGENERLYCDACDQECLIPEEVEVEFQ